MSNLDRGQVELKLGPKSYTLQFDNNAIRVFEGHMQAGIAYVLQNFQRLAGVDLVVKAIHAGMSYNPAYKRHSLQSIGEALEPTALEIATEAVVKGLLAWRGVDLEAEGTEALDDGTEAPTVNP